MLNCHYGKDNVLIPKDDSLVPYGSFDSDSIQSQYMEQSVTVPVSQFVPFCCTINLPPGFNLVQGNNLDKFIYDTKCLTAVLNANEICCQTNCGPVYGTCYTVQIVGSIPYIVSVPVQSGCGGNVIKQDSTNEECKVKVENSIGYICCSGNICVNSSIGTSTSPPQLPDLTCKNVELIEFKTEFVNESTTLCTTDITCAHVKVRGVIKLPSAIIDNKKCPPQLPPPTPTL